MREDAHKQPHQGARPTDQQRNRCTGNGQSLKMLWAAQEFCSCSTVPLVPKVAHAHQEGQEWMVVVKRMQRA